MLPAVSGGRGSDPHTWPERRSHGDRGLLCEVSCQEDHEGRAGRYDEERQARHSGHLPGLRHQDVQDRQEQVTHRRPADAGLFEVAGEGRGAKAPRPLSHAGAWRRSGGRICRRPRPLMPGSVNVDALVAEFLRQLPAVLIVGPRAVGKTTTALRFARTVIRLARDADAAAFRADPDVALHGLQEPVLLDEGQVVPSVLGALTRAVDDDPRPGRFLLTGSVRADIEADTWPGTGRLVRVAMSGLVVREVIGNIGQPGLFERIVAEGVEAAARIPTDTPDLKGYIEMALAGSFPSPALHLQGPARRRWLDGYLDQILTRDAAQVAGDRDPVRLRRYFEALASSTAGAVDNKKLYDAAGINAKTAAAYDRLLTK